MRVQVLTLRIPNCWKIMQLAMVTLWNVTLRDAGIEKYVVDLGAMQALIEVIQCPTWPHSLRDMAAGVLQSAYESAYNLPMIGGLLPYLQAHVVLLQSEVRSNL